MKNKWIGYLILSPFILMAIGVMFVYDTVRALGRNVG